MNNIIFLKNQHDSSSDCAPGGNEGNFIMFARATSGDQKNNRLFSPCSRDSMNGVMDVKGRCIESKCCFKGNTHVNQSSLHVQCTVCLHIHHKSHILIADA